MSVALSVSTEARLRHFHASEDVILAASDLLDEREADKLSMYLAELSDVDGSVPASIAGNTQLHEVNDVLARAARAQKGLEEVRVARVAPLLAEKRAIDELFGVLDTALKGLLAKGKAAIVRWHAAEQERVRLEREAQQRLIEAAAVAQSAAQAKADAARSESARQKALAAVEVQSAKVEQALAEMPREAARGVRSDEGTTSVRQEWALEVVDESLIPRKYLDVSLPRLRAAVRAGEREIPGCLVSLRAVASVRTR